jgi:ammonia channel protein AmtB
MAMATPFAGVVLGHSALATGFLAAAIAVGGFLGQAQALLKSDDEVDLLRETMVGGLHGLIIALSIVLFDAVVS